MVTDLEISQTFNAIMAILSIATPFITKFIVENRSKIKAFRELIDAIDDAQEDNQLSPEEAKLIKDKISKLRQ